MKTFTVYGNNHNGVPDPPNNPRPPCFEFDVDANTRKEAINKVAADHSDYAIAHKFCNWNAYVKDAS